MKQHTYTQVTSNHFQKLKGEHQTSFNTSITATEKNVHTNIRIYEFVNSCCRIFNMDYSAAFSRFCGRRELPV